MHPHLPPRRVRPPGELGPEAERPDRIPRRNGHGEDQARRRGVQRVPREDGRDRGPDHRVPGDDARRGRPRARHAQHVHRLPAQPGHQVPQHGQRHQSRTRRSEQPAPLCGRAHHAGPGRRQRLPVEQLRPLQSRQRPGQRRVPRSGPRPARQRHQRPLRQPPQHARCGERPLRREGKRPTTSTRWTPSTNGRTG